MTAGAAAALADSSLPLWQRVILGGEYEGFTPQPLPPKQVSLPVFVNASAGSFTRITKPILSREMRRDGFRAAVVEELLGQQGRNATSAAVRFGSRGGAQRALGFFYEDTLQPCPHTCSVNVFEFPVREVPGAKGSRRVRFHAEGSKPGQQPFELDYIFFTRGSFAYALITSGKPDGVDRSAMIQAAKRQYDRVKSYLG
jgi:hypothetical protein